MIRKPLVIFACLLMSTTLCSVELVSWDALLNYYRTNPDPAPSAFYLGSPANRLARMFAAGQVDTKGLPVAVVPARAEVLNPISGKRVLGERIQDAYGASAGTVMFFDHQGIPMLQLAMPQSLHHNRPEIVAVYCGYVASRSYKSMKFEEYVLATGQEKIVYAAIKDMKERLAFQQLTGDEKLVIARNAVSGATIDPWDLANVGTFFVYTVDPSAPVFHAQIIEIWMAFQGLNPNITIVTPEKTEPDLGSLPPNFQAVLAHAPREAIAAMGSGPVTIMTSKPVNKQRGLRLLGFQPANVIKELIGMKNQMGQIYNRDLPYGEVDVIAGVSESPLAPVSQVKP